MIENKYGLTEKQQIFCDEYIIDCNPSRAAISAGYSEKAASAQASRLLKDVKIKKYIADRMEKKKKPTIAKQDEVLEYLTSVMRGESTGTEIVVEGTGNGFSQAREMQKRPSEKERMKAAELLGKRYGTFVEQIKVEMDQEKKDAMQNLGNIAEQMQKEGE